MKVWNERQVSLWKPETLTKRLVFLLAALLCFALAMIFLKPEKKALARTTSLKAAVQGECSTPANEFYFASQHDTLQKDWGAAEVWKSKTYPIGNNDPWALNTDAPVYGGGAYDGSYAKINGGASGNTFTLHQEVYLRWNKSHEGWSFGWPRFYVRSRVAAYTKIPGLPVKLKYKTTIQYQTSETYPVGLTTDYHARDHSLNAGTYEMTIFCRASANPAEGTNLFEIGGTRCPIDIISDAQKNGFTVDEKALAEGKVTLDIQVTIESLVSPPIANFKGPIVNDEVVKSVSPGTPVAFINESYDADNNAGTTPGTGITAYDWTITDSNGGTANYTTDKVTYTPPIPGIYQVRLRVADDDGQYGCVTKELVVCGASLKASGLRLLEAGGTCEPSTTPPIAKIKGPLLDGKPENKFYIGEAVGFESESYDPDNNQGTTPGAGIVAYQWMVTDPDGKDITPTNATSRTFQFGPAKEGTYSIKLLVRDDEGIEASQTKTVNVRKPKVLAVNYVPVESELSENKNPGGGLRIFPDKKTPDDEVDRSVVMVLAEVDAREGTPVYFRIFDVDDPFSNQGPLDPNDQNGQGEKGGDNRDVAGLHPLGAKVIEGKAETHLFVSHQPGDNFAVVASLDNQYLASCRAEGSTLGSSGVKDAENNILPTETAKNTEMLTVWRNVYIEVDKMDPVRNNYVEGRVIGMVWPKGLSLTYLSYKPIYDPNIPSDWFDLQRFIIDPQNGDKGAIGIFDPSGRVIEKHIPAYIVPNGNKGPGEAIIVVEAILERNDAMGRKFWLWDDDNLNGKKNGDEGFQVPLPETDVITSSLKDAYIFPIFNRGTPGPEFSLNGIPPPRFNTARFDQPNYWTMYLCGAYQGATFLDGDQELLRELGITHPAEAGVPNLGSYIFFESIRESICKRKEKLLFSTPAHEIGHQFGIKGEESDSSLMDGEKHTCDANDKFNARSLSKIRCFKSC